ncbi:MAG: hypothetical protein CL607_07660 [Anaerolineaceae bacterium]|nr:hypothetical protein [Anaerolineaceae bacterium]
MAVWAILSYLLEKWADVTVYRLPLNLDGADTEAYELDAKDSQFDVDDWQLDDLTENVAISGNITQEGEGLKFSLTIENDLVEDEDEEETTLSWNASDWGGLVTLLPEVAIKLADLIGADDERRDRSLPLTISEAELAEQFAKKLFEWEAKLFLHLWEWDWEDDAILEDLLDLVDAADNPALIRIAADAIARSFLPGYVVIGDWIQDEIPSVLTKWDYDPAATIILANALWAAGYTQVAFRFLEESRNTHLDSLWLARAIAAKQIAMNNAENAIATLQGVISKGSITDNDLFVDYATYLHIALRTGTIHIEKPDLVLIEATDELRYEREAIEAYDRALAIQPTLRGRFSQALLLKYVDEDKFWRQFETILKEDVERRYITDLIDELEDMDDVEPGVAIAEKHINLDSDAEQLITLASMYILDYENDKALSTLDAAAQKTDDNDIQAEIEMQRLIALNSDFEFRFAEIVAKIDADNVPSDSDLEFLEEVIEEAPSFVDAYTALARAYALNDDEESSIEVLLDADKVVEGHPDVMELLSKNFWETGEKELAFEYLNKGLASAPAYVPLLVRAGQMLFDNDQHDDAREFIGRAELIAPRDASLGQLKRHIATTLSSGIDDEE